jgi:dihydroorotate dehydrogenase
MEANAALATPVPIFLKIAPDLDGRGLAEIAEVAETAGIACIIATNTTLSREGLPRATATRPAGFRASRSSSAARGSWRSSTG